MDEPLNSSELQVLIQRIVRAAELLYPGSAPVSLRALWSEKGWSLTLLSKGDNTVLDAADAGLQKALMALRTKVSVRLRNALCTMGGALAALEKGVAHFQVPNSVDEAFKMLDESLKQEPPAP